jgi:hypothetical protein
MVGPADLVDDASRAMVEAHRGLIVASLGRDDDRPYDGPNDFDLPLRTSDGRRS